MQEIAFMEYLMLFFTFVWEGHVPRPHRGLTNSHCIVRNIIKCAKFLEMNGFMELSVVALWTFDDTCDRTWGRVVKSLDLVSKYMIVPPCSDYSFILL